MSRSNSSPGPDSQPLRPQDDRLDSWKEIAAYLRRDESTVRRWEKEGLPVHRHRHKFRAAVFAYKSELDVWWNNSREELRAAEGTPEADATSKQRQSVPPHAATGSPRRSYSLAAIALLVVAVLAGGYWIWLTRFSQASPAKPVMLAVLPLQNLSGDPEQEYFSDGLTEEMITQLSRMQPDRLAVIARTSTMRYKTAPKPADEIGRELGVDYILEGSVRQAGGQVRITVQLIRTGDQTHVWADNYQRDVRDVLTLQSQVAAAVAREISLTLSAEERAELDNVGPVNPEAHQLYLRGRYLWNQRTEEALQKSIAYFQQAIAIDPGYAPSHAALADAYNVSGNWGMVPPKQAYPQAKAAASKALEINPRLAEAHIALAYAIHLHDWSPMAAEAEFQRGLQLNPNYAPGRQWYAVFLASEGRFDEAITQITRARELDPLSLIIGDVVGWIYSLACQNDRAVAEFKKALELDPKFYPTHYDLGIALAESGMFQEAIAELEQARALAGDTSRTLSGLAYGYALAGQDARARELLADLHKLAKRRYVPPFDIAVVYSALGDKDLAFAWLERAYQDRHPWLVMLKVTPKVDKLRSDPRFAVLSQRISSSAAPLPAVAAQHDPPQASSWFSFLNPLRWFSASPKASAAELKFVPFMTPSGLVSYPAFSPDGQVLAFTWEHRSLGSREIFVKAIGSDEPLRLTSNTVDDFSPAWSPDGTQIAFLRSAAGSSGIFVVSARGGAETKLLELRPDRYYGLDWSPDGNSIAYSARGVWSEPYSVHVLDVRDRKTRQITTATKGTPGDWRFAFSPDGNQLAVVRHEASGPSVLVMPSAGGASRVVYSQGEWIGSVTWSADGGALVLTGVRQGGRHLWKVRIEDGKQEMLTTLGGNAFYPVVARRGNRMAFVRDVTDSNLWRIDLKAARGSAARPVPILNSTRTEAAPSFSPDGTRIAFQSDRSGSPEIWISDADGSNARQMTFFRQKKPEHPEWSPDGRSLVIGEAGDQQLIEVATGQIRAVGSQVKGIGSAVWSRDGQWLYYWWGDLSRRAEIWKVPATGGEPVQLTKSGGLVMMESPDGRHLFFTKWDKRGIWRMGIHGGNESLIVPDLETASWHYWQVFNDGIYYLNESGDLPTISFFDFATRRSTPIASLTGRPGPWYGGLTVSPDRRWLIFSQNDYSSSEIVLVENYR